MIFLSHEAEAQHNESIAIGKICSNSSYFFRYTKKSFVLREDLVQLRYPDGATIDDRSDICKLLLSQFSSAFSDPSLDHIVCNPEFFFKVDKTDHTDLLTSVELSEETIIDSIKDMASSSSPGPDGLHASIFKNCNSDLVKPLKILFENMFEENHIPSTLKKAAIVPILRVVINYH